MDKRRIAFIVLVARLLGLLPWASPASGFFGYRPKGTFHSVPPTRVVDTATRLGIPGPLGPGVKTSVTIAGSGEVPTTGATAVLVRVTAAGATRPSLVTTQGAAVPGWWLTPGAILPVVPRRPIAATLAVPLTDGGTVTFGNQFGTVGLTVDVLGWWGAASPPPDTTTTTTTTVPPPDTTTTTTTTTTVPPPPVEPPASARWQYVPASVLLNGAGDTATVDLRKVDVDGTDYDVDPPAGVTLQILGATTAFDVVDLGGGQLRLTATGSSGTTVRVATVPGQSTKAELTVTAAELQPGVVEIPDSQVLYPPPGLPAGFAPGATSLPGITATGPGPFTWAELSARVASAPASTTAIEHEPLEIVRYERAARALIASGRRAAARETVLRARTALDEIGVAPGGELAVIGRSLDVW